MNWQNNLLYALKNTNRWKFVERDNNYKYIFIHSRTVLDTIAGIKFEAGCDLDSMKYSLYFEGNQIHIDSAIIKEFLDSIEIARDNARMEILKRAYS